MKLTLEHLSQYDIRKDGGVCRNMRHLSQFVDKYGYKRVNLWINGSRQCLVHRLVAMTYIANPENKPQVNHIDCNKQNNNVENLEWVTAQENRDHAVKNGRYKHQRCSVNNSKGFFIGEFESYQDAANELNLDQSAVSKVANGKYKTTKGYKICKID